VLCGYKDKNDLKNRGLITNGYSLPYNPELTERAKELRNHMTLAEQKLWDEFLRSHKCRFRPQKQIDNYIINFYNAKFKIVIEIDGKIHDELDKAEYDKERTKIFESYGLKVIRFKNEDIINNFNDVCKRINELFSCC